ncbi:hypothetical protein MUK42_19670 [Musa troglodytarum]|uniref:Uncharacterized protein n=1 Tax=Musa troglodytarum TaxID=320322 RepID=A0A9E7HFA0_9LILI|nr:hypothetical protein MUK42_19670 [Musa troglodytarum]
MKLRINKACDLGSISVLPPRRSGGMSSGGDGQGRSQASQIRSQSQQSFSQGVSLSQLSQSSFEDPLVNDQASEELENKLRHIESSISRVGMILDSVQSDVMQVNRAAKELSLEAEGIRQKVSLLENSMQQMVKWEDDIKAFLGGSLTSISDQLNKISSSGKVNDIASAVATLQEQIFSRLARLECEICRIFSEKEVRESGIKSSNNQHSVKFQSPMSRNYMDIKESLKGDIAKKEVYLENADQQITNAFTFVEEFVRVIVDLDEESDGGISCLIVNKETGTGPSGAIPDSLQSSLNKHEVGSLADEFRDQANLDITSVKTLMEEAMSQHPQKKFSNDEALRVASNLKNDVCPKKNYKRRSKSLNLIPDAYVNNLAASAGLNGHQSASMDLTERSFRNFDMAALLRWYYRYTCQQMKADSSEQFDLCHASGSIGPKIHNQLDDLDDHLDLKITFFWKTLADVALAIKIQKSMVEKQPDGQWAGHLKEFMDALDTLNSDKELSLKFLQDPDSLLLKHIQNFCSNQVSILGSDKYSEDIQLFGEENNSSGISKESDTKQLFHKQNRCNFFWKKGKSKGTKSSKESSNSKALFRIVVLKPSSARIQNSSVTVPPSSPPQSHHMLRHDKDGERILFEFSLREVKRKVQHMIGESRKEHVISMDAILHRTLVWSNDTGDSGKLIHTESAVASSAISSCNAKKISESLSRDKRKDKKIYSESEIKINSHSSSSKHQSLICEEAKKHLAEMLDTRVDSLPVVRASESLRSVLSLSRCNDLCPRSSPQRDKELIMSPEETADPSHVFKQEGAANNLSPERPNLKFSSCSLSIPGGESNLLILKTEVVATNISEPSCLTEESNNKDKGEEEEAVQGQGSFEGKLLALAQSTLPSSSLTGENSVAPESTSTDEKLEQPSRVSALETILSEDSTTAVEHYDIQAQHCQVTHEDSDNYSRIMASPDVGYSLRDHLHDKRARFDYVKKVLEASGLTNEFSERRDTADQLLDPSLFDEIGIFFWFLQDDPKLLFDCMNEVLVETQERLSLIQPNLLPTPSMESLIQEVSNGLERHLHIQLPNTLDQAVRMDLRFESENIAILMCESFLDDIMEETVHNFWF